MLGFERVLLSTQNVRNGAIVMAKEILKNRVKT